MRGGGGCGCEATNKGQSVNVAQKMFLMKEIGEKGGIPSLWLCLGKKGRGFSG